MKDFIFKMPAKVRFGEGIHKQLGTILKDEMGFSKVFVATDKGIVATGIIDKVKEGLDKGGIAYEIYDELIPDPTIEVVDEG